MQACWLSKEFEVRLAARGEEALHLFVFLDGLDNFALVERAGVVLVDEEEDLLRGVQELPSKFFDFLLRRLPLRLAGRGALLELVRKRLLDALLPARNSDR